MQGMKSLRFFFSTFVLSDQRYDRIRNSTAIF